MAGALVSFAVDCGLLLPLAFVRFDVEEAPTAADKWCSEVDARTLATMDVVDASIRAACLAVA